ncbi:MAG: hypothetical protein ABIP36_05595 [Acidimicrobiales bacterium]
MRLQPRNDLRVDELADDILVLDATGGVAHQLSGDAAEALRLAQDGVEQGAIPANLQPAMQSLIEAGIVESSGWSRRKMLLAGGVGLATAGAGIVSMSLPAAAQAASCIADPYELDTTPGSRDISFTTGPGITSVTINTWGGGGGGGTGGVMGGNDPGGHGGGGGAFAQTQVSGLMECTTYAAMITVGAGGSGATGANMTGGAGVDTSVTGVLGVTPVAVLADGGLGGSPTAGGMGGTEAGSTGTLENAGGAGGAPAPRVGGGGGGSAGAGSDGGTGMTPAGGTAGTGSPGGAVGGAGGNGNNVPGANGTAPGGGGGGGGGQGAAAGSGAPGGVSVTFP